MSMLGPKLILTPLFLLFAVQPTCHRFFFCCMGFGSPAVSILTSTQSTTSGKVDACLPVRCSTDHSLLRCLVPTQVHWSSRFCSFSSFGCLCHPPHHWTMMTSKAYSLANE